MIANGIDFLLKGGFVMWPLFACAVIAVAVMIERFIALNKAGSDSDALMTQVRDLLSQSKADEALALCQSNPGPIPQLLATGIRNRHLGADSIERLMEELALVETPTLYLRLNWLDTIITIAPLLGLLGTVTGMIRSFHVVASAQALNAPTAITGGVAEALIATATGLAIAIVTLVGYNALTEKVKRVISQMEIRATQLINIVADSQLKSGA
ncbi:MAG TPA: MotA/TolQ/ExbB proton channel family protein [Capsulimonadaceae bacterium]|jgi:biopolymer transport protein ExbB